MSYQIALLCYSFVFSIMQGIVQMSLRFPARVYNRFINHNTLRSIRTKLFSEQIRIVLLLIPTTICRFITLCRKVKMKVSLAHVTWTSWQDNSSRVRTHERDARAAVHRLGTIIQRIFCAQSGIGIRVAVWKWSVESRYPGALSPVLKNVCCCSPRLDWPPLGLRGWGEHCEQVEKVGVTLCNQCVMPLKSLQKAELDSTFYFVSQRFWLL